MGGRSAQRAGKKRAKQSHGRRGPPPPLPPPIFPPPPPPGSSSAEIGDWLGNRGIILVLFETPSGFALLRYDGIKLFRPGALKDIWARFTEEESGNSVVYLEEFQIFKDKSRAINPETGVISDQLAQMIQRRLRRDQKLAVGKSEYKTIIEAKLRIHCLFDEPVMELMWGLKNLMKSLVPGEGSELTNEDRRHMSRGMESVLNHYGFQVKPEMVNGDIIISAATLYECDYCVNKFADYLHCYGQFLEEVSGIDSRDWDLQKLSTALTLICCPDEKIEIGNSEEMLSEDMAQALVAQAHLYEDKLHERSCLNIYREIMWVRKIRSRMLTLLESQMKKAEDAYATPQMVEEKEN
ncbi:hypothetical protein EJB05_35053 [Eragrostis curvula]|uniref:Uncharacterized protein n=1 Tax=Eragrostis curvula TaxID=38414 RepID=A0A5J9U5M3_9POAL|nr:hypothetical protein EJB05_35053 [Eragrostis curvula]